MAESQAHRSLYEMADLYTPMAIRVAATLRLADHVAAGATTVDALAEHCGAQHGALAQLLRHLTACGVLARDGRGAYGLTDLGSQLRDDHPESARAVLDIEGAVGRADLAAVRLLHSVRTGEPAYPLVYGRGFWDDLARDAHLSQTFDRLMAGHDPSPTVDGYAWGAVSHVVDVGGGDGTVLAALLAAYPHLRGTLVELPGPAEAARRLIASRGVANRAEVHAGSFFDPLPGGGDVYLLSNVIHDWDDEAAVAVLRRCAEAAGQSGRVVAVQGVVGPDDAGDTLRMLLYFGGSERTLGEFVALGGTAGLTLTDARPLGSRTLVEFASTESSDRGAWDSISP